MSHQVEVYRPLARWASSSKRRTTERSNGGWCFIWGGVAETPSPGYQNGWCYHAPSTWWSFWNTCIATRGELWHRVRLSGPDSPRAQDALCIMHEMRHAASFIRVLYGCLICESAGRGVRAAQFLLHTPATPLRGVANCLLLCTQLPCLSSFLDIYLAHVATK